MGRWLGHVERLRLLRRIFVSGLPWSGYANLLGFSMRRFLLGRKIPVSVMIALTYRCQCDCAHCAITSLRRADLEEMPTATVMRIMEDARRLGAVKVGFTGGEPLLRGDIARLVRHAYDHGLSNAIDTNGLLLDRGMARELKQAGVTNVNVSVDHADARHHDRLRRLPGCQAAAWRAVEHCAAAGIPCVVSTYVTDRSLAGGGLAELIRLAKSAGASAVRVLFPVYSGRLRGRRPLLSRANQSLFFNSIVDASYVYSESPFYDFLSGRMECAMLKKLSIYVTAYGDVKYCYASRGSLGSVRTAGLREILEGRRYFDPGPADAADCQAC